MLMILTVHVSTHCISYTRESLSQQARPPRHTSVKVALREIFPKLKENPNKQNEKQVMKSWELAANLCCSMQYIKSQNRVSKCKGDACLLQILQSTIHV